MAQALPILMLANKRWRRRTTEMSVQCNYCKGPRSPEHDRVCLPYLNRNEWVFWLRLGAAVFLIVFAVHSMWGY